MAGKEFEYPFLQKDYKLLRHYSGYYGEAGMMALWDIYLETANDWVKKNGYAVGPFVSNLPRLVDNKEWRNRRRQYEQSLPKEVAATLRIIREGMKKD